MTFFFYGKLIKYWYKRYEKFKDADDKFLVVLYEVNKRGGRMQHNYKSETLQP